MDTGAPSDSPLSESASSAPFVSVLMSVFNAAPYLRESIESILNQTFTNFEFIIIDDASTDDSAAVIQSYQDPRIRLVKNSANVGLSESLNTALSMARGMLVARQDADDISVVTRLEKQIALAKSNHNIRILGTEMGYISKAGRYHGRPDRMPLTQFGIEVCLMFASPVCHATVLMETALVRDILDGYSVSWFIAEDHDLWVRAAAARGAAIFSSVSEVLYFQRILPTSLSHDMKNPRRVGQIERMEKLFFERTQLLLRDEPLAQKIARAWSRCTLDAPAQTREFYRDFLDALRCALVSLLPRAPDTASAKETRMMFARIHRHAGLILADKQRINALRFAARCMALDWREGISYLPRFFALLAFKRSYLKRVQRILNA